MEGVITPLLPTDSRPTAGVLVHRSPQWAWIARSLGFRISWVWARDTSQLPVWLTPLLDGAAFTTNRSMLCPVDVLLSDSGVPRWLASMSLSSLALSLRSPKSAWPWGRCVSHNHQALGGLTTKTLAVNILSTTAHSSWVAPPLPVALSMPIFSIASDTTKTGRPAPCPSSRSFDPPLRVRGLGGGCFHGGGLYPLDVLGPTSRPTFLLPSVYGWRRRRLTQAEEWMVFDVPHDVTSLLPSLSDPSSLLLCLQPGRCLQQGLKDALLGLGFLDGGGDFHFASVALRNSSSTFKPQEASTQKATTQVSPALLPAALTPVEEFVTTGAADDSLSEDEVDVKATKGDDAEVDVKKWNRRLCKKGGYVLTPEVRRAVEVLRNWLHRLHVRRTTRSFFGWLHQLPNYQPCGVGMSTVVEPALVKNEEGSVVYDWTNLGRAIYVDWFSSRTRRHSKDLGAGRDAIQRIAKASWWEWCDGSRPLHWKWPKWYREVIRDGLKVWFKETPKFWRRPQAPGKNKMEHESMKRKLGKVRDRRYLIPGNVDSLTSFFAVPKGVDDIRMVYDGTKSGLNDVIWVPRFSLPTVNSLLRAIESDTHMADFDIGECFLNFVLHESMQALCGVDLTEYFGSGKILWERWARAAMGLKSSPYQAVQAVLVAKDVVLGERRDPGNAYRWDSVRLNLPGSEKYDPTLPWVSKIRLEDGKIACDLFIYVDDGRVTGPTKDECWKATRQAASRLNSLGVQEAPRKRRWSSRTPGAWAGSIVESTKDGVMVMVDEEKWDKSRRYIGEIIAEMKKSKDGSLGFKDLERKRGFLIYVTRTYPAMVPFLKGIHLTLDGWRPNRDVDGWKMQNVKRLREESRDPPERVKPVNRLGADLWALSQLMDSEKPPKRRIRSRKVIEVFYGFGDASAEGACTTLQRVGKPGVEFEKDGKIYYRYGHWCTRVSEESSNYRELLNLVETLEIQVREGKLYEAEVFLFTDNSTAEGVFYKGNSTSKKLFELVVRLRRLEMVGKLTLHVIHVAGTRMIESGSDGGSRGDLNQGAMAGVPMITFVPLHLNAEERFPGVEDWVHSWWNNTLGELQHLTPEGWFDEAQKGEGPFLWTPPPAAADVAAELLGEAKLKRPNGTHVVVVPRLMTGRWRRLLIKETDFYFKIPAGVFSFWPQSMHEPLTIFVSLPLIQHSPWTVKGTPFLETLGVKLRGLRTRPEERTRSLLRKFCEQSRRLQSVPESMVRRMLYSPSWKSISD